MKYIPHPYQQYAIDRILSDTHVALFLDMGLGKTSITLTAIDELMYNRFEVDRVLIIAPKRVAEDTWSRESKKWSHLRHLRISKVVGSQIERTKAMLTPADIYITNRENVEWICENYADSWFDMVVIDELSSFKSPSAKRFKALKQIIPKSKRVVGLTGTPAPNGLIDLWSQIYLLDRGVRLGRTITDYRNRYFNAGGRSGHVVFNYVPKENAEQKIYERLSDIAISMKAKDFIQMPDRIDNFVSVRLTLDDMFSYNKLKRSRVLTDEITAANAAVLTNKLLQLSNGAVYRDDKSVEVFHDCKLDALGDLVESANGNPILIFYLFKHDADRIQKRFGARMLNTESDITEWNSGSIPIMLAHPASAGHGVNLQDGGHTIIWFSVPFSLELYEQANARLHRQGQKQTVVVHHLVCDNTFDGAVIDLLGRKENRQEQLLKHLKAELG